MLALLWSTWVLLAMVEAQGPPGGGGPPPGEQECVLLITSPVYMCDDDQSKSYMDTSDVQTTMHNASTTFVSGDLVMLKELDVTTRLEIQLLKIANGQKEMMMTLEIELCKELGREDSDYYNLLKYPGFPEACPIAPLEIQLLKIANGQKEMMMTLEIELCKELGREDSDYYNLLKYLGFPEACPISPGTYPINNLVADLDDLPINSGNMGQYEAVLNFWQCNDEDCKDRDFECCAKLDCMIEPL